MHIILTNDDGINAPGIQSMLTALTEAGYRVTVCAPETQQSAKGRSVTIVTPLIARKMVVQGMTAFAISGTPADCVNLALDQLAKDADLVVSGINRGDNLGSDIGYSGTVSAGMEAAVHGVPALAVSLCSFTYEQYEPAANMAVKVLRWMEGNKLPRGRMLNLNVPPIEEDQILGLRAAPLAHSACYTRYAHRAVQLGWEDERDYYWMTSDYDRYSGADCDADWISRGYATVTPLTWDFTDHKLLRDMPQFSLEEARE